MTDTYLKKGNNVKQLIMSNALESINFQKESLLFKELTLIFTEMKKLKKDELADSELIGNLSKTIMHHTGCNISFDIGIYNPCIEVPQVNKNNILINSHIKDYFTNSDGMKLINTADGMVRGTVNMVTSKVTGVYSEFKATIHLPTDMFVSSKYIPEEIAAVTLHEIGHLFTFYEFMSRSVTTNQVLAGIAKSLDKSGTIEDREYILLSAKKALKLKDLDTKELAKSTRSDIAEIVIITRLGKQAESELGSNIYDFTTWEYLCDQFAARHGAGRYLVTSLEKIFRGTWNIAFRSLPAYLFVEALKITLLVYPTILVYGFYGLSIIMMSNDSNGSGDYDNPKARFKRIRDQIVENLKDRTLDNQSIDNLMDDLVAIDKVLDLMNDRRQLIGILLDTIIPMYRKNRNQTLLQKNLEDLAVNELFVKSKQLQTMA